MRILFIGDIVGEPGVRLTCQAVPRLRERERLDLVVANAENAADGSGLTPSLYKKLHAAGIDAFTLGDHVYKRRNILKVMTGGEPLCKPANFPPEAPGREFLVVAAKDGTPVGVFTVLGRLYMRPVDCPFHAADRVLKQLEGHAKCIVVDAHAEATGDKALLGRYLDGRVTAVVGTHTHVPTADETVLPGGTAFISDVGMTGPHESILGRRIDRVLETGVTFVPTLFEVATGDPRLSAVLIEADAASGRALSIRRMVFRPEEVQ